MTDRTNRPLVHLLRILLSVSLVHDNRILAVRSCFHHLPSPTPKPRLTNTYSAKRRIAKGLAPLGYNRWLLNRQQRATYDPEYQNPSVYYNSYQQPQYGMHPMPPPLYDPNSQMPPTYSPPEGATKVDPSQWRTQPTRRPAETGEAAPDYEAPAGPPPAAALRPDNTGASNNPYRL